MAVVMDQRSYYDILGINQKASDFEIRKAYKELAIKYHPDKNMCDQREVALERFKELNQAYAILQDESKRMIYDIYDRNHQLVRSIPQLQNHSHMQQIFNIINQNYFDEDDCLQKQKEYQKQSKATEGSLNMQMQMMFEQLGQKRASQIHQLSKMLVSFIDQSTNDEDQSCQRREQQLQMLRRKQKLKQQMQQQQMKMNAFYMEEEEDNDEEEYDNGDDYEGGEEGDDYEEDNHGFEQQQQQFCEKKHNNIFENNDFVIQSENQLSSQEQQSDNTNSLLRQLRNPYLNRNKQQQQQQISYAERRRKASQEHRQLLNLASRDFVTPYASLQDLIEQNQAHFASQKVPIMLTKKSICKQQQKGMHQKVIDKIRLKKPVFKIQSASK